MKNIKETVSRSRWTASVCAACVLFGLLTIVSGGLALFGGEPVQAAVGDAVPYVLWFNFLAGFFYVMAGYGLYRGHRWAAPLVLSIAVATVGVLLLFLWHVSTGKPYEMRTVFAMVFRSGVWISVAIFSYRNLDRSSGTTVLT